MPTIPNMSLKVAPISFATFTPGQYEFQTADMSIYERAMAQKEARLEKAVQGKSAIDRTLGEIELKLNPTEAKWFEEYKNDIRNQIKSSLDSGDYGAAGRTATLLAGDVLRDPRILGRMRSQEAYNEEVKTQQARRDRGEIKQATYDWWYNNKGNQYSYTDLTDDNGNYIEGNKWEADFRPVKDLDWGEQAALAFKLISPKKNKFGKTTGGSTTNADGTGSGGKHSEQSSAESISEEDILKNIDELLSATSDGYRQAEQAYNVAVYDYEKLKQEYELTPEGEEKTKLKQQLDARNQLMKKNGSPISYKEYYARMVSDNRYAHTLAYNWTSSDTENISNVDNEAKSSSSSTREYSGGFRYNYPQQNSGFGSFWKGANVVWGNTYSNITIGNAITGIGNRFSDNKK